MVGDNGWINRRLIYMKDCQKNTEKHARGNENNNTPPVKNANDDEQAKSDMDSLKRMMIRNCNIAEAVDKLNSTRKYRKELMKKTETDLRKNFPFFLSNPNLVGFFFLNFCRITYPNNKNFIII